MKTRLFAFGSNGSGQLGLGHLQDVSVPGSCIFQTTDRSSTTDVVRVDKCLNASIVKIVAGGNHTMVLTSAGVYVSGNYSEEQSDIEGQVDNTTFRLLSWSAGSSITDIAATWEASFFVQGRKRVLSHGFGSKGEIGIGPEFTKTDRPEICFEIPENEHGNTIVSAISAAMNHVVVLLSDGRVYGWGACRKGQLGTNNVSLKTAWKPGLVRNPFPVEQIAAGRDFTVLYAANGEFSILGVSKNFLKSGDSSVFANARVQSGWSCLYFLRSGRLTAIGRHDRGQSPQFELPLIKCFAAGSEHAVAHAGGTQLLAWGWGEHGNCGDPIDERGNVVVRYNVIDLKLLENEEISGVAAGCATSFSWVSTG